MQTPLLQDPPSQLTPQPPQLEESLLVSTHFAPQQAGVVPVPTQLVPQAPQFASSSLRSVQLPAQQPGEPPSTQALPQAPQFFMSAELLTQALAQQRSEQGLLQAPQLEISRVRSVQPPSQTVGAAFAQCGATMHCPLVQVPPAPQSSPQKPQLAGSLSVSTHPPEQHDGEAPEEHAVPHAPQLALSKPRSVHPTPSQQPAVDSPSVVQSTPHDPQLCVSPLPSAKTKVQHCASPAPEQVASGLASPASAAEKKCWQPATRIAERAPAAAAARHAQ
jgi:hypothetical protein